MMRPKKGLGLSSKVNDAIKAYTRTTGIGNTLFMNVCVTTLPCTFHVTIISMHAAHIHIVPSTIRSGVGLICGVMCTNLGARLHLVVSYLFWLFWHTVFSPYVCYPWFQELRIKVNRFKNDSDCILFVKGVSGFSIGAKTCHCLYQMLCMYFDSSS